MSPRIPPAPRPYSEAIQRRLEKIMGPGKEPLVLFTTLARDERLFERFTGGGLLDRGHLTLRQREIVIDRVTASCGSEYEWGVHVTMFAEKAKLPMPCSFDSAMRCMRTAMLTMRFGRPCRRTLMLKQCSSCCSSPASIEPSPI